ncbi:hypothetical protein QJQ45_024196 [Haematococcus lacustris]|nr:hypothetical protein QJQ45_024196 [Haematococcus lacustris]
MGKEGEREEQEGEEGEEGEGEEDEGEAYASVLDDQEGDYEDMEEGEEGEEGAEEEVEVEGKGLQGEGGGGDGGASDLREFKGWQVLDRSRIQNLALALAQSPDSAGRTADAPNDAARVAGAQRLSRTASRHPAPASASKAPLPVLDVHFNSGSSRPAKPLRGKKARAAGVQGHAPAGAKNVLVWLRQDLRLHDNPALSEASRVARQLGGTVTLLFTHSPEEDQAALGGGSSSWGAGGASLVWLQVSAGQVAAPYGSGCCCCLWLWPVADNHRAVHPALSASPVQLTIQLSLALSKALHCKLETAIRT